jgi:tRNA A37 methylthiotransferase MiaB
MTTRVLSLISPMTQLNTPYPSTAYITGFLRSRQVVAHQSDIALGLVLRVMCKSGLQRVRHLALQVDEQSASPVSESVSVFLDQFSRYENSIEAVIRFLQGKDPTLAHRINGGGFLPEGPRFDAIDSYIQIDEASADPLAWAFGSLGAQDRARHLATLYLNDLADVIACVIDPRFAFVRYGEKLAASQASFDPLADALAAPKNWLDDTFVELALQAVIQHQPSLLVLSVPFPGAVYASLRIAQAVRLKFPEVKIALGGGYANTELRQLREPRLFDFVDFVCLDSGEAPLLALIEHIEGRRSVGRLIRTFARNVNDQVVYHDLTQADVPFNEVGTPTWDGLALDQYLSLLDMLNPMHRLWSDGRWNKLTVAHGCYWKKCSFCDVSLDYISRFEAANATDLVDKIEAIVKETGQTGFHFVDEAAPPKALKALAQELIKRQVNISWWGNIRFEKTFTPQLCQLLADSGCIAISGGLEVASDRLLKLMNKGVSVEQVAQVTRAFSQSGVLVHAYLMYGFPTQTVQDTVDALEYVRQLFLHGCIQSGFFHRFTCTVHSPVGKNPAQYGVSLIEPQPGAFARNDIEFVDPSGIDHDALGVGLNKALYNFMHGVGLDENVRAWFEQKVPRTLVKSRFIEEAIARRAIA